MKDQECTQYLAVYDVELIRLSLFEQFCSKILF